MYEEKDKRSIAIYDDYGSKENDNSSIEGFFSPFTFLCFILILLLFGLVSLFSASFDEALREGISFYSYLVDHLFSIGIGIVFGIFISLLPLRAFKKIYLFTFPLYLILLALYFFLPNLFSSFIFTTIIGTVSILSIILMLSDIVEKTTNSERKGFYIIFLCLIELFFLISTTYICGSGYFFLIVISSISLMISYRVKSSFILYYLICSLILLFLLISNVDKLFYSFSSSLFPNTKNYSESLSLSLLAIEDSGTWGVGIGKGLYKLGLIEEPSGLFIFATVVEECGLLGIGLILVSLLCILIIAIRTLNRAKKKGEDYIASLVFSFSLTFVSAYFINALYASGLFFFDGIIMPLFSYNPYCEAIFVAFLIILYKFIYKIGREQNNEKN